MIFNLLPHDICVNKLAGKIDSFQLNIMPDNELGRNILKLQYTLLGDLSELLLPDFLQNDEQNLLQSPADFLWKNTCFELFLSSENSNSYMEYNFAPNGLWTAYLFKSQRVREMDYDYLKYNPVPNIIFVGDKKKIILSTKIPAPEFKEPLIGISAILNFKDAGLCYFAPRHRKKEPDFHDKSAWLYFKEDF